MAHAIGSANPVSACAAPTVIWRLPRRAAPQGEEAPLKKQDAPGNPWVFTPRGGAESTPAATQQSDDAVMAAAMQAVLATPRGSAAVDDALMAGAANKIFKFPMRQSV